MKAEDAPHILDSLPQVILTPRESNSFTATESNNTKSNTNKGTGEQTVAQTENASTPKPMKNDPNRSRLVLSIYTLHTTDTKLQSLFKELKEIPLKYTNAVSASIRIFLDIAVRDYIIAEGLETDISKLYKSNFREVQLYKRLSFLKDNKLKGEAKSVIEKLLNSGNEFSIDVLNGYVHSSSTLYNYKQFLNRFWDFLFPLFEVLLDIKETKE